MGDSSVYYEYSGVIIFYTMHTHITLSAQTVRATLLAFGILSVLALAPAPAHAGCDASRLGQVSFGTQGSAVSALQECLIGAGFSIPAGVTGYYGAQTKSAVQQFYASHMALPTWDGLSVGPLGRGKLASLHGQVVSTNASGFKRAGSASVLATYLAEKEKSASYGFGAMRGDAIAVPSMDRANGVAQSEASPSAPTRVSETNVQVAGIDEPDIVKTDGSTLFISEEGRYYYRDPVPRPAMGGVSTDMAIMPPWGEDTGATKLINAFPPESMANESEITEHGELLLAKDTHTLVVLSGRSVVGYNVADTAKPVKKWTLNLENNTSVSSARLRDGTMYLVTTTWLDATSPCPVVPLMRGASKISIPCADIWVPARVEPVDMTYNVIALNPATGEVGRTYSVASQSGGVTVAMFKDNLYLATKLYAEPYDVVAEVYASAYRPFLSEAGNAKVQAIRGYDISSAGKLNEITLVFQSELAQKSANEKLRIEREVENAVKQALEKRKRDLDRTRIVRIPLSTLTAEATGDIPGSLLNQFALDEYNGDLRVAVTVNPAWWGVGETANDVYVLGSDLRVKGSVTDLALGERVYAARFLGDTGYLVTFKQVDPFFVLDLSVPTAPKVAGELKIPGYSAYLEPLGNDMVLGVGREGSGVKLALFDVSNPKAPVERAKYLLTDEWSDVEGNHHAFLRDAEHEVFFIPGGQGGYVFSYAGNTLSLKATVAGWSVKRAVYIGDYLYVIGDERITVFDENTWKEFTTFSLK